jgi:hypothetical protein
VDNPSLTKIQTSFIEQQEIEKPESDEAFDKSPAAIQNV